MPILTRNDGAQFVIQAHRELLTYKRKSLLSQRVRHIAEGRGPFASLIKKRASQYEVIFSHEPGYLLGESVQYYFNQAQNLIFCEALAKNSGFLVVVVRKGMVCLDTVITENALHTVLAPLLVGDELFQVVTFGETPFKENAKHPVLPSCLIASFEKLDNSLFERLPKLPVLKLLSLPLVLKPEHVIFRPTFLITIATMMIISAIVCCGLLWEKAIPTQSVNMSIARLYSD